jgi:hypothetical protein
MLFIFQGVIPETLLNGSRGGGEDILQTKEEEDVTRLLWFVHFPLFLGKSRDTIGAFFHPGRGRNSPPVVGSLFIIMLGKSRETLPLLF